MLLASTEEIPPPFSHVTVQVVADWTPRHLALTHDGRKSPLACTKGSRLQKVEWSTQGLRVARDQQAKNTIPGALIAH